MIVILGQFPPPVNGMSNSTQRMLDYISLSFNEEVKFIDFSTKSKKFKYITKPFIYLVKLFSYIRMIYYEDINYIYIAVSGGEGLLFELIYILIAVSKRIPVGCHYHTNNFILEKKKTNQYLFSVSADITHILLCSKQIEEIESKYNVNSRHKMLAIGNAWMFDDWNRGD